MKRLALYILFSMLAISMHCCTMIPESTFITERIEVGPGPEDMVLDTLNGAPRLLISCTARREAHMPYGEIEALDLETGSRSRFIRHGEPADLKFRPHGIYMEGAMLYVISHEKEPDYHPILIYRIHGDSLSFTELIHTRMQHSPNALVTGPGGEIYLVNDSGKRGSLAEKAFRLKRASVVKLSKGSNGTWESKFMALDLGYPAGINRIGNRLYVGDAILHRVHIYSIANQGLSPVSQIRDLKGNDNIRIHDGKILIPGHIKPLKFIKHAKDQKNLSPVEVFLADPKTGETNSLFLTDGSQISAGSTAIIFHGFLYICQVFDPFILKVKLD
jgi:hypothetical protein